MFKVLCPRCKHYMNYQPINNKVINKKKRCVYCGKTFTVYGKESNRIIKKL